MRSPDLLLVGTRTTPGVRSLVDLQKHSFVALSARNHQQRDEYEEEQQSEA